jgi:hypothetical protein
MIVTDISNNFTAIGFSVGQSYKDRDRCRAPDKREKGEGK